MTTSLIPGRPVPAPVLATPESAAEHVRNALQTIMHADRTAVSGRVALTAEEYAGVCYRLERAIGQLEGRVA